jgi:hypothetical protein
MQQENLDTEVSRNYTTFLFSRNYIYPQIVEIGLQSKSENEANISGMTRDQTCYNIKKS